MKHYDADSYFAKRAPRYQMALRTLPTARVLDLLPYCAVIEALKINSRDQIQVADAFGGTGFLARGLSSANLNFVVCDCCQEMLCGAAGTPHVQLHETQDDFQSVLTTFGNGHFDLVLSHGGLHHVVDMEGVPNVSASRVRQCQVVKRLARMVRSGGALIIADIPDRPPVELGGLAREVSLSTKTLQRLIGGEATKFVEPLMRLDVTRENTLDSICQQIRNSIVTPVSFPVPKHFFDQYVACKTPSGHVAVYVDFDEIDRTVLAEGFKPLGRLNYLGPWLFQSESEAGWFFKEKFGVGIPQSIDADVESNMEMFEVLKTYLGTVASKGYVAVNWGVTYAAYVRL